MPPSQTTMYNSYKCRFLFPLLPSWYRNHKNENTPRHYRHGIVSGLRSRGNIFQNANLHFTLQSHIIWLLCSKYVSKMQNKKCSVILPFILILLFISLVFHSFPLSTHSGLIGCGNRIQHFIHILIQLYNIIIHWLLTHNQAFSHTQPHTHAFFFSFFLGCWEFLHILHHRAKSIHKIPH